MSPTCDRSTRPLFSLADKKGPQVCVKFLSSVLLPSPQFWMSVHLSSAAKGPVSAFSGRTQVPHAQPGLVCVLFSLIRVLPDTCPGFPLFGQPAGVHSLPCACPLAALSPWDSGESRL